MHATNVSFGLYVILRDIYIICPQWQLGKKWGNEFEQSEERQTELYGKRKGKGEL